MKKILLILVLIINLASFTSKAFALVQLPEVRGVVSGSRQVALSAHDVVIVAHDIIEENPAYIIARTLVGRAGEFTMPAWDWPAGIDPKRTEITFRILDLAQKDLAVSIEDGFKFKYSGLEIQRDLYKNLLKDLRVVTIPANQLIFQTPVSFQNDGFDGYLKAVISNFFADFSDYKYSKNIDAMAVIEMGRSNSSDPGNYFWNIGYTSKYDVSVTRNGIEFSLPETALFYSARVFDHADQIKRKASVRLSVVDNLTQKERYYFLNPTTSLTSLFPEYTEEFSPSDPLFVRGTTVELLKPSEVRDY